VPYRITGQIRRIKKINRDLAFKIIPLKVAPNVPEGICNIGFD